MCPEKAMAPHSSTLAWKIPWAEEPGRLQSMGSLRIGRDWTTERLHFSLSCIGEGNGNPLQCSCLENPRDGGAWWAAIYGVAQSRTRLKWLSSSSSYVPDTMLSLVYIYVCMYIYIYIYTLENKQMQSCLFGAYYPPSERDIWFRNVFNFN